MLKINLHKGEILYFGRAKVVETNTAERNDSGGGERDASLV